MRRVFLLCLPMVMTLVVTTTSISSAQTAAPANDAFADAVAVTQLATTISGTITGATTETGEPTASSRHPDLSCGNLSSTVWYRVQLANETPVEVRTADDVSIAVYTGTEIARLRQHDCLGPNFEDYFDHTYQRVGFWALPGKTYYLQVGATESTSRTEFTLRVERFNEPEPYPKAKSPCRARDFKLFSDRQANPKKGAVWYLNTRSVPRYLRVSEVKRAIVEALKNIARSRNDCGLADKVSIRTRFGGSKKAKASACDGFFGAGLDKLHVIEFKDDLWASGVACRTYQNSRGDVDIQLRGNKNYFTTDPLTTWCQYGVGGTSDLEVVLTHELGHAYGLDHTNHNGNLTMFWVSEICSSAQRTLGLGDILGLRRLY